MTLLMDCLRQGIRLAASGDRMKGYVCERLAAPSYEADTERENQSAELLRDDDVEQHRTRLCIWHHAHF